MAEFEEACRDLNIPLFVLPPRTPQLNGGVERCNGASCRRHAFGMTRYEFHACTELPDSVTDLNRLIDDWQEVYNFVRPHGALGGLTPAEYMARRPALTIPNRPNVMNADRSLPRGSGATMSAQRASGHARCRSQW